MCGNNPDDVIRSISVTRQGQGIGIVGSRARWIGSHFSKSILKQHTTVCAVISVLPLIKQVQHMQCGTTPTVIFLCKFAFKSLSEAHTRLRCANVANVAV